MDFHSLSRRELQSLCKRNSIPANMTNLAMADALASLRSVEGLEDPHQPFLSPKKAEAGSPEPPKTGRRTSTRPGSPLPRSRRVAASSPWVLGDVELEEEKGAPEKTPRPPVTARKGVATGTTRVSKKEEETVGVTTRRRATRHSSTATDAVAFGSISTRRSTRGRAAAATKMPDLTSKEEEENDAAENVTASSNDQAIGEEKDLLSTEESKEDQKVTASENIVSSNQEHVTEQEHQEEKDVAENVTASNDQAIGEEEDLLSIGEPKEDQKVTGSEIVSSNQENVTEQEHQEEKEGLEANGAIQQVPNEEENVQVEEEPIVEMAEENDQNEDTEEEGQVTMSALEDSPVSGLISCEDPKEEGREESGADDDLLLLGLQRISISVEPKEGDTIDPIAPASQDESLGSCNDDRNNKENGDRVTITLTKAELGSISLRKLKAMYKDIKIKEGEEKRSALKALDENSL